MSEYEELRQVFEANGQGHIFAGWQGLSDVERDELLADAVRVDFGWLEKRLAEFKAAEAGSDKNTAPQTFERPPITELPKNREEEKALAEATEAGEELLRAGKAAAFLVAGGQGTRLGYDGPKGCYPIGPISSRTLFEWHAEQIRARARRYGKPIPWYIMTSRDNDAATKRYFEENDYLGLSRGDVFFFQQEMVPSIDFEGRLMLATPSRLAMNPNGHGGAFSGLYKSGALDDMSGRGVEHLGSFQVDNPLITICDPTFLGLHARAGARMSTKVLVKSSPDEKIGVVVLVDGKTAVVEYSDLDEKTMNEMGPDGKLKLWAGSIGIHMIEVKFAVEVGKNDSLPWHQAKKKVAHFNGNVLEKPQKPNAVKFETFIFDALPLAGKSVNFEVRREREFAPVKNAEGADSVETCRRLLSAYFGEWLVECGVALTAGAEPDIEISPLYSLDAAELATKVKPQGVKLEKRLLLG